MIELLEVTEKLFRGIDDLQLTAVIAGNKGNFKSIYPSDEKLNYQELPILLLGKEGVQLKWLKAEQVSMLIPSVELDSSSTEFLLTHIPLGHSTSVILIASVNKEGSDEYGYKSFIRQVVANWLAPSLQMAEWKESALRLIEHGTKTSIPTEVLQRKTIHFIQFLIHRINKETGASLSLNVSGSEWFDWKQDLDWDFMEMTIRDFATIDPHRLLRINEIWNIQSPKKADEASSAPAGLVRTKKTEAEPKSKPRRERKIPFYGVPSTLNRYEDAAVKAKDSGKSVIGKVIGELSEPPLSAAAITDYVKKHKEEVVEWLGAYPEKWPIIRKEFTTISKLEKLRQLSVTDSSTDKG